MDIANARMMVSPIWCQQENQHKEMDVQIAEPAAKILSDETERLIGGLELAWGLIANSYGGDWSSAPDAWREAAEHWRDDVWHKELKRRTELVDAIPS